MMIRTALRAKVSLARASLARASLARASRKAIAQVQTAVIAGPPIVVETQVTTAGQTAGQAAGQAAAEPAGSKVRVVIGSAAQPYEIGRVLYCAVKPNI